MEYWTGYSENLLSEMEYKLLSNLKTPYKTFYVPIILDGIEANIWTISLNSTSQNTPLCLLHGFAEGIGLWALNFDALSEDRPVYAMDIIGFGRSSRPNFGSDCCENEGKIVESIEQWRSYLGLEAIYILGHSMSGYLATAYTLKFQTHVKHLILCDPWGFSDEHKENLSLGLKILGFLLRFVKFNPLGILRSFGPFGPSYLRLTRQDVLKHFKQFQNNENVIPTYVFQCNAHPKPTGETAFYSMLDCICWAKFPMIRRIVNLKNDIPILIMFGSESFMDKDFGSRIKKIRPDDMVDVKIIENSGHHIYADNAKTFNEIVNRSCTSMDGKNI